ncbi:MAG: AAA family ATPase, partial [Chitinophagaceae bacterium]|nr:AAA family ATPase [Chitinophagaceae bacterium]
MKITKIQLKDFHQFKDLTIDLTYPKGHFKEGQPLDKVCLIGQSGTGKTSLLELIPLYLYNYETQFIVKSGQDSLLEKVEIFLEFGVEKEYSVRLYLKEDNNKRLDVMISRSDNKTENFNNSTLAEYYSDVWLKEFASKLVYFPANLNYDVEVEGDNKIGKNGIIDFSKDKVSVVWYLILEQIQSYQEQELQIRQEISKAVELASNDLTVIEKALNKLKDWKKTEFNPIQDIADNCLNKILKPFKLRVKTELNIKSKEDIGFIKIEDFSGNEIPNGLWSTGTKQVVLSAMPLYLLKPKHTVILFDEPERSLYPDVQR